MRDRAGKALIRSWFVILCATTALAHAVYAAVRVMISYRALELGGDGATVGVRTTVDSLVPFLSPPLPGRAVAHPGGLFTAIALLHLASRQGLPDVLRKTTACRGVVDPTLFSFCVPFGASIRRPQMAQEQGALDVRHREGLLRHELVVAGLAEPTEAVEPRRDGLRLPCVR
jgi:hypothetical protein